VASATKYLTLQKTTMVTYDGLRHFYFQDENEHIMTQIFLLVMNTCKLGTLHFNNKLFLLWKCERYNLKFWSPESPPPCGHTSDPRVGSQY